MEYLGEKTMPDPPLGCAEGAVQLALTANRQRILYDP